MGAGQSTDGNEGQKGPVSDVKTSYYELLGVEKSATDDEIKKAYRRKALELHPDRNYGDVERATALFAEIQSAYEILSDPQERAWYDSHEDAILRDVDVGHGADAATYEHNVGMTSADDLARMFRQFNAKVEFSDAPSGFFGHLRETFAQLAKEEQAAAAREGLEVPDYPDFGHEDDDHDTVKGFYSGWSGFSTRKTFAWRDRYRMSDAEERRMRRLMEKENRRFRMEGIQEFNDAVRSLLQFVKKRDPRYMPNQQSEEERQRTLRDAAKAQAARMRAANQAKLDQEVPEWTKVREPEDEEELFEEESEEEQFECVACRKVFKSENQYAAHERSKKHVKSVQALRKKLEKEGVALDLEEDEDSEDGQATSGYTLMDDEGAPSEGDVASKVSQDQEQTVLAEGVADLAVNEPIEGNVEGSPAQSDSNEDGSESSEDDFASPIPSNKAAPDSSNTTPEAEPGTEKEKSKVKAPGMGKAAQKRAKKAAQQAVEDDEVNKHKCQGCAAAFPSKARLFQHLDDHPAHASLKSGLPSKSKSAAKKKGKR